MIPLPTEIDFGKIAFGSSSTKIYSIPNTSNKDIMMNNIGYSCTCTSLAHDKAKLLNGSSVIIRPNTTAEIIVTLTPGSTGIIARTFWFKLNNISYTITLKAYVS